MKQAMYAALGGLLIFGILILIGSVIAGPAEPERDHRIDEFKFQQLLDQRQEAIENDRLLQVDYEIFDGDQVKEIIEQDEFYNFVVRYGAHEDGIMCAILYGINKDGERLPIMLEFSHPCPPNCNDEVRVSSK